MAFLCGGRKEVFAVFCGNLGGHFRHMENVNDLRFLHCGRLRGGVGPRAVVTCQSPEEAIGSVFVNLGMSLRQYGDDRCRLKTKERTTSATNLGCSAVQVGSFGIIQVSEVFLNLL